MHWKNALENGHWFKLITGASYQYLPAIRNLVLAYGLAGADCIDLACDAAVIVQVQEALISLRSWQTAAQERGFHPNPHPLLMVSLNDDQDPHFRKAEFDATTCPPDCPRPCATICPALAIAVSPEPGTTSGVQAERCYGCGRCLPICPIQNITTISHSSTVAAIAPWILTGVIQAIEIHTQIGHEVQFQALWQQLEHYRAHLQVLAVSCPDGDALVPYLQHLAEILLPLPCALIWQTDGRSMSGDIGKGTTHATIQAGQKVLQAQQSGENALPGFVQLAGGTNHFTVPQLRRLGLLNSYPQQHYPSAAGIDRRCSETTLRVSAVAGVGYGSYARKLLQPILEQLDRDPISSRLEDHPEELWSAVALAHELISPLKYPLEDARLVL